LTTDELLQDTARAFSKAKHALLRDFLKAKPLGSDAVNTLKRDSCLKYGLTSRQYNAMLCEVEGLIDGTRELQKLNIEALETRIKALTVATSGKKRKAKKRKSHACSVGNLDKLGLDVT
jgi:hypothetical protein